MGTDFLAGEPHFLAHLAPIWHALPLEARGRFVVTPELVAAARARSIAPSLARGAGSHVLVAGYGDLRRARLGGWSHIARAEHGAGQSYGGSPSSARHPSYPGGSDHADVELFLAPNEYAAARWRAAYPGVCVSVIGSPKVDRLPVRAGGPGPVVAFSWHFDCRVAPETRPAVQHFIGALPALAERYRLLGHAHPRYAQLAAWYRGRNIEIAADFDDVAARADLYVADNTSTLFEFAATGRPVVLLNAPGYRRNVEHGGRFWAWASIGMQCDHPADLASAIAWALDDPPAQRLERERVVDVIYPNRGRSAELAARALVDWAGAREEAAA